MSESEEKLPKLLKMQWGDVYIEAPVKLAKDALEFMLKIVLSDEPLIQKKGDTEAKA